MNTEVLTAQREIINETDREMARLFEQRMEAVKQIALWTRDGSRKSSHGTWRISGTMNCRRTTTCLSGM